MIPEDESDIQTSVYRENTPKSLFTNFHSFAPFSYKIGLIKTLIYHVFEINWSLFHQETSKTTHLLGKDEYSPYLIVKEKKFLLDKRKMKSFDMSVILSNKGASSNYII